MTSAMVPRRQPPALAHVRALLGVVSALRSGRLDAVLGAIAEAIAGPMAFRTVAVNLRRPGRDELEVVLVHGDPAAREALLGRATALEHWAPLLDPRFDHGGAFFVPGEQHDWDQDRVPGYVPERPADPGSGRWHPRDALLLPLRDATGGLLAVLSVDEPAAGLRPSDAELDLLVAIAAHAAVVVEQAMHAADRARERDALERLLLLRGRLAALSDAGDALRAACDGVAQALGFAAVVALVRGGDDVLRAHAAAGAAAGEPPAPVAPADVPGLLDPAREVGGCVLEHGDATVAPPAPGGEPARRPAPLRRILVPLRDPSGAPAGALWLDGPPGPDAPATAVLAALRLVGDAVAATLAPAGCAPGLRPVPDAA
jgi:hypothetical protein